MQIKVGTLVMWTKLGYILDKGSVGLVTDVDGDGYDNEIIKVLWSNGDVLEYNTDGQAMRSNRLIVVKF
jgi:hypothetical protein